VQSEASTTGEKVHAIQIARRATMIMGHGSSSQSLGSLQPRRAI
jgi:hypothetical protein